MCTPESNTTTKATRTVMPSSNIEATLDMKTTPVNNSVVVPNNDMTVGKKEATAHTTDTTTSNNGATNNLPWYRSGGMVINLIGMVIVNLIPPLVKMCHVPNDPITTREQSIYFLQVMFMSWVVAFLTASSKTTYCIFVVSTYLVSFIVLPMILQPFTVANVATILIITSIVASIKVNICMSVCMHRYASHAAFKCGPMTNIAICILSCFANQGGPLWWSSQHRCHHKFCELPRDPHSPTQIGTERAFGFFLERFGVDEEFVPQHLQFVGLRVLDTWAFLVVSFELWFAYTFCGGNLALYVAFTSGWMSQTISLWFNIANHPIENKSVEDGNKSLLSSKCTASDGKADVEPTLYLPFYLLDAIVPLFSWLAMEDQHEHHHNHGNLAKRSPYDVAYWTFIKPLETLGLIWNVVVK